VNNPALRTKSVTAKLTEDEYARLQEFSSARGQNMGELARELLLAVMDRSRPSAEETILAEVLALRMLYLNSVQILGQRRELSTEDLRKLIERVDREKQSKAHERLTRKEVAQ
jgi:hypothetical protein